jgi:hypothetical protein
MHIISTFNSKLQHRLSEAEEDLRDATAEFGDERTQLLAQLRGVMKEAKLYREICASVLEPRDQRRLIDGAAYDEERENWLLPNCVAVRSATPCDAILCFFVCCCFAADGCGSTQCNCNHTM